jgi:hypothetical protein
MKKQIIGAEGAGGLRDFEFMHKLTLEEELIIIAGISAIFNPEPDRNSTNI